MSTSKRSTARARVGALLVVCLLLAVAHTWPYARAPHRYSRVDNVELAGFYTDYFSSVSRVHYWGSRPFVDISRSINLPGVAVLALSTVALFPGRRGPAARQVMCATGVVALPIYKCHTWAGNASSMLDSTNHWKPSVDGYSGFMPASYTRLQTALAEFPGFETLETMHQQGITRIVVHEAAFTGMYGQARFDEIGMIQSLHEIARDGDRHVYRLR